MPRKKEAAAADATQQDSNSWIIPDQIDLPTQASPAPAFPRGALPEKLRAIVESVATARCIDFDLMATTVLATASGAIGNRVRLALTPNRHEPLAEFFVMVTGPGEGKSEAMDVAREVLDAADQANEASSETEDPLVAETNRKRNRKAREAVASRGDSLVEGGAPTGGKRRLLMVTDATVAGIRDALVGRPEGGIVMVDELLGSIGMTAGREAAKARTVVLQAYDGKRYVFVSGKHGELTVPALQLMVLGGTQPDRVGMIFGTAVDGLSSRFLFCAPDVTLINEMPESDGAADVFIEAMRRLSDIKPAGLPDAFSALIPISQEAREVFAKANVSWNKQRESALPLSKSLLARGRTHALRLAGIMTLTERALSGGELPGGALTAEDADRGVALVDSYFLAMGERVLTEFGKNIVETPATQLLGYLVRLGKETVNARSDVRKGRGSPLHDPKVILDAFEDLRVQGLVRKVAHAGLGRPADIFEINPYLLR